MRPSAFQSLSTFHFCPSFRHGGPPLHGRIVASAWSKRARDYVHCVRWTTSRPGAKEMPAKLTTLFSSIFQCSYRCSVPRACGTAFIKVQIGEDPHHFRSSWFSLTRSQKPRASDALMRSILRLSRSLTVFISSQLARTANLSPKREPMWSISTPSIRNRRSFSRSAIAPSDPGKRLT